MKTMTAVPANADPLSLPPGRYIAAKLIDVSDNLVSRYAGIG